MLLIMEPSALWQLISWGLFAALILLSGGGKMEPQTVLAVDPHALSTVPWPHPS